MPAYWRLTLTITYQKPAFTTGAAGPVPSRAGPEVRWCKISAVDESHLSRIFFFVGKMSEGVRFPWTLRGFLAHNKIKSGSLQVLFSDSRTGDQTDSGFHCRQLSHKPHHSLGPSTPLRLQFHLRPSVPNFLNQWGALKVTETVEITWALMSKQNVHKCVCAGASLLPQHCGLRSPNPEIQFGGNPVLKGKEVDHVFFPAEIQNLWEESQVLCQTILQNMCPKQKIPAWFPGLKLKEALWEVFKIREQNSVHTFSPDQLW